MYGKLEERAKRHFEELSRHERYSYTHSIALFSILPGSLVHLAKDDEFERRIAIAKKRDFRTLSSDERQRELRIACVGEMTKIAFYYVMVNWGYAGYILYSTLK